MFPQIINNFLNILKENEIINYNNITEYVPEEIQEAFWDAVFVDLPTYFSLWGVSQIALSMGLTAATGPFAIPASLILWGTTGAFAGYTIRKTCNSYFYEGEHSMMCGAVGNAAKYVIKGILGIIEGGVRTLGIEVIKGAVNGALYEGWGDAIGGYVKDGETIDLFGKILLIENVDAVLAKELMGKNYLPEAVLSSVASGFLTGFISYEETIKGMIQEAIGTIEELMYANEPAPLIEKADL